MADSLMARLRARFEEMQAEMQPEAGFDRRAYGYGDDGADATFEEVDLEEESPWHRPGSGPPQAAPEPEPEPARSRQPARARPRSAASLRTGDAAGQDYPRPAPPPGEGAVRRPPVRFPDVWADRGAAAAGDSERTSARGPSRLRRLRRRISHPNALRELFLLREVIDRPVALRVRPRGRRPS